MIRVKTLNGENIPDPCQDPERQDHHHQWTGAPGHRSCGDPDQDTLFSFVVVTDGRATCGAASCKSLQAALAQKAASGATRSGKAASGARQPAARGSQRREQPAAQIAATSSNQRSGSKNTWKEAGVI